MISVDEAFRLVAQHAKALTPHSYPICEALGLVLVEDVVGRTDSPPFDKSMVDGYAIDLNDDSPTLKVSELVTAGHVPSADLQAGQTIQVMTGAPTPPGAQAVVKWEDCDRIDGQTIRNPRDGASPGHCILKRGTSYRAGDVLLRVGKTISPIDVALLAEIGRTQIKAAPRPTAAVLATGDELVEAGQPLSAGEICNSNGPMLAALLTQSGVAATNLGIARDDVDDLRSKLQQGLEHDVLLVSGGVSAGVKDLVPGVLADLGVKQVFHKVRMKPGKPLWFGVFDEGDRSRLVFGLPGNPVSTLVSFHLFVRTALRTLSGHGTPDEHHGQVELRSAQLAATTNHRGGRPTYHPCRRVTPVDSDAAVTQIEPLPWRGSADLATMAHADCLAVLPAGDYELPAGAPIDVIDL